LIRAPRIKEVKRIYRHVPRMLQESGRWVCKGGPTAGRCEFNSESYADAVTHATLNGANPPDMPSGSWTSA
jgi:hypothetical protein